MTTIRLSKRNKTIKVVNRRNNLRLQQIRENIKLQHTGKTGPQGPPGSDATDKNFIQAFTNQSTVTVTHNLNKYPSVTVIDSADAEVIGDVQYIDLNTVQLAFVGSFSGKASLN